MLLISPLPPTYVQQAEAVLACSIGQLSLTVDADDRDTNPPTRDRARLFLRNVSRDTCSVPALFDLIFVNSNNEPLDVLHTIQGTPGMISAGGPPVTMHPSSQLTSVVKWQSANVLNEHTCQHTVTLTYHLGSETGSIPFEITLCGHPKPHYTTTRFQPYAPTTKLPAR